MQAHAEVRGEKVKVPPPPWLWPILQSPPLLFCSQSGAQPLGPLCLQDVCNRKGCCITWRVYSRKVTAAHTMEELTCFLPSQDAVRVCKEATACTSHFLLPQSTLTRVLFPTPMHLTNNRYSFGFSAGLRCSQLCIKLGTDSKYDSSIIPNWR